MPPILIGTFIGVGVGGGVFVLLVLSTVVVVILVVVIVKRKAARKQKMYNITRASLWYHNSVVVEHEEEKKETVVLSADKDGDGYQDVDIDKGEDDNPLDGFITYEVIDGRQNIKNTRTPAPKDAPTSASAPNVPAVYAVVNKKRETKKTESGFTVANNDPWDVMEMKKMATMTNKEEGVVSGSVEEEETCDDVVEFRYEPKAES